MLEFARRPVILNQIGGSMTTVLGDYADRIDVISGDRDAAEPWKTGGADILLTGPSRAWAKAPSTPPTDWKDGPRWVQIASAGIDSFPDWVLSGRHVTCGRGDAATPIAEFVLSALLDYERDIDRLRPTSPREWEAAAQALRKRPETGTLHGRTLGLAGYGAIGQAIAVRARAFGMRVQVLRRSPLTATSGEIEPVQSLTDLFRQADHLVLAMPLTQETRGIVDREILQQAKPGLHLVNIARGALIGQDALLHALDAGRPAFATLDVTTPEPLPADHPFYTHPRVRLTPHISWAGPHVRENLARRISINLDRYLRGEPLLDTIDPTRGY
ncbi:NAD(P)-dependent oxidoreductase [Acetobacter conturbans]|uniref:Glyoxylate reductase (NADP(+)) n=1 Tax=Acetobacter conturbans TaxID=1737472 RepID=A0ABX0K3N8_9PROT|nr:NAD(P)-dependent oxidoreductase [Acetobacter conturbans]NHN88835.1 glyoxylate reductase (NADP(+)) [Acetobacter conturbans]